MYVVTGKEMQSIDRRAIEKFAIPGIVLMENAAIKIYQILSRDLEGVSGKKIAILAGKGNNGGDGFALARHLKNGGAFPQIYLFSAKEKLQGDAKTNMEIADRLGIPITEIETPEVFKKNKIKLIHNSYFVDAIFGSGLSKPVKGFMADVISFVNERKTYILSVDIPSGLSADRGEIIGPHIIATTTIALAHLKRCHVLYPSCEPCGRLVLEEISIPREATEKEGLTEHILDQELAASLLRERDPQSHKGTYGHLLALCGSRGKGGAAALASKAALRAGTGLVTLALPHSLAPAFETEPAEVMTAILPESDQGEFAVDAIKFLPPLFEGKAALLAGPGLGRGEGALAIIKKLWDTPFPLVLDADGINGIDLSQAFQSREKPVIVTPHPGEMAALWGVSSKEVQENRIQYAKDTAEKLGAVTVLKGARTLIASPEGLIYINTNGNSGLATGGTGDVLAGLIAGLLSQNIPPLHSALLGVFIHGRAGDLGSDSLGDYSLIAGDLLSYIPDAFKELKGFQREERIPS